jgi:hypothetical protein
MPLYTRLMGRFPHRFALAIALVLATPVLFLGQSWGLPGRTADRFLFGSQTPWTGSQLLALSGGWHTDPSRGADVAGPRDSPLLLNATDADRARIMVRYRLYSYQPDEMITFRALAGMHPGRGPLGGLDPCLYQYGGLWIYPVGILLKIAPVTLKSDIAWYLDHPEDFGRFYVVARCYSAAWGLVGVTVIFLLVRRITGGWAFPMAAGILFALLPVVVNQAHEAKPHLAGAVLMLCAVLAGSYFVETGNRRTALLTGALCGAAVGMVLSTYPIFLILPSMVLLRRERLTNAVVPCLTAIGVYVVANPYVVINLVANRQVLASNLGNSSAMYHAAASASALTNAMLLIANGTGMLTAVAGVIGAGLLARRATQKWGDGSPDEVRRRGVGLLLAIPAVWMAIQFVALASGKPGEYGRFALYLDVALAIEAIVAIHTFTRKRRPRVALVSLLLLSSGALGARYFVGFLRDCQPETSRMAAAEILAGLHRGGKNVLVVASEPAPYCLPPVDLFSWKIELTPRGQTLAPSMGEAISISPTEASGIWGCLTEPRISWADRRFTVDGENGPVTTST